MGKLLSRKFIILLISFSPLSILLTAQPASATTFTVTIDHVIYEIDTAQPGVAAVVGQDGSLGDTLAPPSSITASGNTYSVTSIGVASPSSVRWGSALRTLIVPPSVTQISNYAFFGSPLTAVQFVGPSQLVNIGDQAFYTPTLTSVTFGSRGTSAQLVIQYEAFATSRLTQIVFPEGDIFLQDNAFDGVPLRSVTMPFAIANIDNGVFSGLNGTITFPGQLPRLRNMAPADGPQFGPLAILSFPCSQGAAISNGLWNNFAAVAPCTLTFDTQGGNVLSAQNANYGAHFIQPTAPTRAGFQFQGWYTDSATTTPFDFSSAISSNETAYAKWSAAPSPTPSATQQSSTATASATSNLVETGISFVIIQLLSICGLMVAVGLAMVVFTQRRTRKK